MNSQEHPRFTFPSEAAIRGNSAKLVTSGSAVVKIYGRAPGPYTIAWRESAGGARKRAMRASLKAAKKFAESLADNIANGQTAMNQFGEDDRASYLRSVQILRPTGKALELAASEYAEACAQLAGVPLAEAVKFFLENRPRGFIPRPIPDLVEQFLAEKQPEISIRWHAALASHFARLSSFTTAPLHALNSADINRWLRSLDAGPRTRHNYRAALDELIQWAKGNGHLPRTWSEMERVPDPGLRPSETRILTPEQMIRLLGVRKSMEETGKAQKSLVPFLALAAFAGIRHEEMNGEKALLNWRDIRLSERTIYVPKGVAKTGRDRIIPINDNLAAWLEPYARTNGPISPISQTSGALVKAKRKAGIPCGKDESRNTLRKSFISYRLAVVKNIAQVAEEAGNSSGIIRKHYHRPIPEAEGKRWFGIWPTTAAILQLNFAGL